jgi:hypothetical protein
MLHELNPGVEIPYCLLVPLRADTLCLVVPLLHLLLAHGYNHLSRRLSEIFVRNPASGIASDADGASARLSMSLPILTASAT